jgi:S-formylglutathione hydrolase FrmB
MIVASWFAVLPATLWVAGDEIRVSSAATSEHGVRVHDVTSPFQAGRTRIRVLLPEPFDEADRYPVVYLLPVEAGDEHHYGDALAEVLKRNLHKRHGAIFVAPTFSHLPWYADHESDPRLRQETYFLQVVVPSIEKHYPAVASPTGRNLLGFSKSGWGAWTLLLRHPQVFGRAAAWDAPLAMDRAGRYGSGPIFGTQENFSKYRVCDLLSARAADLGDTKRLILMGRGGFGDDLEQTHRLLKTLKVPHVYRDGPQRKHDWHSGWVSEAVELLLSDASRRAFAVAT